MRSWWRAVAAYPPTWVAILLVVAVVWFLLTTLEPSPLFTGLLFVLGAIAIVMWPLTMSTTGDLARLQFAMPRLEEVDDASLAELADELNSLDDARAAYQLRAIQQKRDNLVEILGHRLEAGEMTYARYLTTAQQVYLAALDNLNEVALAEQSISAIDSAYIRNRLQALQASGDGNAKSETASLQARLELKDSQEDKIAELLAQNESAMTLIDRTSTALADAPIGKTPQDAEASMEALKELAERANRYATG